MDSVARNAKRSAAAVALGLGLTVAAGPGLAWAEDAESPATESPAGAKTGTARTGAEETGSGKPAAQKPRRSAAEPRVRPRRTLDAVAVPRSAAADRQRPAATDRPAGSPAESGTSGSNSRPTVPNAAISSPSSSPAVVPTSSPVPAAPVTRPAVPAGAPTPALATPRVAVAAVAKPAAVMTAASTLTSSTTGEPAGAATGTAVNPLEVLTAALAMISREINRLLFNRTPTAKPVLHSLGNGPVVTGTIGGSDPDDDPLAYSVTDQPNHGTVAVDPVGTFTYTADPELATAGGTDTFVVEVRDTGFHLNFWVPTAISVPVTVTVQAAAPDPVEPDPVVPDPVVPDPVEPDPVEPDPVEPDPVEPDPVEPDPVVPDPVEPDPVEPDPVEPVDPGQSGGTTYSVTTTGPDIVGFDPTRDKLDFGDVSVHDFIVVDTPDGVGFRSPWTGETSVIEGVSLGQLTVDSFTPIINDHLRQDLSGALAWEQGVTPAPNTVYARSHEVGQVDQVSFNPATDVVDFRYFGTREQLYLTDSPDGVIVSTAGTGQTLILQDVTTSQLTAANFVFHFAQVREDALNNQLGIGAVPDSQVRPQGVPVAGTDRWPTAAGNGAPPSGQAGTTTVISWQYGTKTVLAFDPAQDRLDFGWFKAEQFDVTEPSGPTGSTQITILGNNQTYTLDGVGLEQLSTANIIALDAGTRVKWQSLMFAAPAAQPGLSIADRTATEGDSGTSDMVFTVALSEASAETVSVGYSTSNGTATAAGLDYLPSAGSLTFAPGQTARTITVTITGDTQVEVDEQFTVTLSAPVNATITDGTATGTIVNDDVDIAPVIPPTLTIADLAVAEGDGGHGHFMFTVSLDKAWTDPVSVQYATADGTAVAGLDYTAAAGTLTFAPGVTTQLAHVDILGDLTVEADENFTVALSNPIGATILDGSARGTILDDDEAAPLTPGLSISDASITEPSAGGMAPGFLRTSGNQIIDSAGNPVQISGVNWFGMESTTGAPHGLWTRSYTDMIDQMAAEGFNTIRLPYASEALHSTAAPNGIDFSKNPELQGLTSLEIMDAVIDYAGQQGMRVILDHHRSGFGTGTSGNGLWYDGSYTEDAWVADWQMLAERYSDDPTVIGMDLHNEPHNGTWGGGGATDWARAAERAGNAVLAVNPDLLVFVEGVGTYQGQSYWWGGNLMGVADRPITLDVPNRVVYSPHDYPNSVYAQPWFQGADFGAALPAKFRQMWGYIYEEGIAPLYIGEFGTNLTDPKDVVWFEAITSYISGDLDNDGTIDIPAGTEDISWTFWSWNPNSGDTGGILADDWLTVNENKMVYLTAIQFAGSDSDAVATFRVSLTSASTQPVTVQYATSNMTASAGGDYTATSGTVTFAPGETEKMIAVLVQRDILVEGSETFMVMLSNPSGATVTDAMGVGTILDRPVVVAPPVDPGDPVDPGHSDHPVDPGHSDHPVDPDHSDHPVETGDYVDLMTFGMSHGSDHTGMDALVGGRTPITTEAVVAYNDLRRFTGLAPATIEDVGRWAFANGLTNNTQAWGTDVQGVGLFYAMQGAKVGWIADDRYDPQIVADIERTARLGSADDVMAMVAAYGHDGYAEYLLDNGYDTAFINTLKMETHWAGWMHDRAHGRLLIEGGATAHDVNHLTVLSHDQMQPFMNDTWDYPQWPALDVSDARVVEYFQSMVTLGDPLGDHSIGDRRTIAV